MTKTNEEVLRDAPEKLKRLLRRESLTDLTGDERFMLRAIATAIESLREPAICGSLAPFKDCNCELPIGHVNDCRCGYISWTHPEVWAARTAEPAAPASAEPDERKGEK